MHRQNLKPDEVSQTLRLRLKDKHAPELRALANETNFVWNYCNDLTFTMWRRERRFLSGYDFHAYTRGATNEGLKLSAQSVQAIGEEYAKRRRQHRKAKLHWRTSWGPRRSLGWVPFKSQAIRIYRGQLHVSGVARPISLWDSYGLQHYILRAGNFSEDARGRWYLNVTVVLKKSPLSAGRSAVGIDLGLKDFFATSSGDKAEAKHFYRELEPKLIISQRARHKARTRAIHAKVANRRKYYLQKLSTALVKNHGVIFVGNVNATALATTKSAKAVYDAGWSAFRTMLHYKCDRAGVWFEVINEAYSTQTCSACLARSGPKGLQGLGIRAWACPHCATLHDRDVNAARNILAAGHGRLAEGICGP